MTKRLNPARIQQLQDFTKQIVTLSTGSLVLLASLLDKFVSRAPHKMSFAVGVIGFAIAILGGLICGLVLGESLSGEPDLSESRRQSRSEIYGLSMLAATLGFLTGIGGLVAFVLGNLWQF
jgi:hypothetical protein